MNSNANLSGIVGAPEGYFLVNEYLVGPNANLSNAYLSNAYLTGADLTFANLFNADLTGIIVNGATWTDGTVFGGADYTITHAEYETALSDLANAIAERDARPTQAAYDAVVAESNNKYNLKDIADLREGSKMIEISNGEATISMEVEKSDELGSWTVEGNLSTTISVEPGEDKKFFRFKMNDSDFDLNDLTPFCRRY